MRQQMYRMFDADPSGMFPCTVADAPEWNKKGWGVFVTVNDFAGERRKANLKRINAYAVDLDTGTKEEMQERIREGLVPSLVVETKRGFHVWFLVKDGQPEYWNAVMLDRLVPFYGADKNARDICRVLRMPGYFHMKDPSDPFLVKEVWRWGVSYTQTQIAQFYPDASEPERTDFVKKLQSEYKAGNNFWENVYRLDCLEALERLSGSEYVGGEVYTFKATMGGKFNLLVNGRGCSVWVDAQRKIGSLSDGGPSIANFLKWYGRSWAEVAEIIKKVFPEVTNGL